MSAELIEKSKEVLANTFVLAMKAQGYHWNVVGPDFIQLHDFFGKFYEEVEGAIDDLAEHIRQLDSFAPGTLQRLLELSTLDEDDKVPPPNKMLSNLMEANEAMLNTVVEAYELAEKENMFGYSNFLQDRISAHSKHRWMLKSLLIGK